MQDFFYSNNLNKVFAKNLEQYIGKPNLKFLELGSHSGSSASGTLNVILTDPTCTITCVDSWNSIDIEEHFNIICKFYSPRIIKAKNDSVAWLRSHQDLRFDFIYVDADHSAEGVFADANNAWALLKPEGIMAFDDYLLADAETQTLETKTGIDQFLESIEGQYKVLDSNYQLWITKNNFS